MGRIGTQQSSYTARHINNNSTNNSPLATQHEARQNFKSPENLGKRKNGNTTHRTHPPSPQRTNNHHAIIRIITCRKRKRQTQQRFASSSICPPSYHHHCQTKKQRPRFIRKLITLALRTIRISRELSLLWKREAMGRIVVFHGRIIY